MSALSLLAVLLFAMGTLTAAPAASDPSTFNVRAFGAKGDGQSIDTTAINAAIDAASAAGGGTVLVPAGTYVSGSVHLKSNIMLYLDQGATLEAGRPANGAVYDNPEDVPGAAEYEDYGHRHFHNSFIWGDGLTNVAIEGPGRIWGLGLVREEDHTPGSANKAICLKLCREVTLKDFTIQHGGWFGILATGDDLMTIDGLKEDTNRDGMDIDSCRNVHIENCTVNSPNDDGICLKSSYGLGYARPTQDVTITNCIVSGFDEGTMLDGTYKGRPFTGMGRIKLGTESNGGFINITISNCVFEHSCGLALESVDGGPLEDISVSNITMRDVTNIPIFLRLGARLRGPAGTQVGDFGRIDISNVTVYNSNRLSGCIIDGLPGNHIHDVNLRDIRIWYLGGGTATDAAKKPREMTTDYPDPGYYGVMPAFGIYARHVDGLTLDDIQLNTLSPDARPAYVFDDVSHVEATHAGPVPQ